MTKLRIGITGSPGTGKKSTGAELSRITGKPLLSINEYAITHCFGSKKNGEFEVDEMKLNGKIPTKDSIVFGHMLPYLVRSNQLDFVAVLRCSPSALKRRFASRGYSKEKVKENVEAELLGVIAYKAFQMYGPARVAEFDTTRANPKSVALMILDTIIGKRSMRFGAIDWLSSAGSPESLMRVLSIRKHGHTVKDN